MESTTHVHLHDLNKNTKHTIILKVSTKGKLRQIPINTDRTRFKNLPLIFLLPKISFKTLEKQGALK